MQEMSEEVFSGLRNLASWYETATAAVLASAVVLDNADTGQADYGAFRAV